MCTGIGLAKPAFALLACEFEHPLVNTIVHATVATQPNFTQGACMCIEIAASTNPTCCALLGEPMRGPFDRRLEGEPEPPRHYRWNWKRVLIRHPLLRFTMGLLGFPPPERNCPGARFDVPQIHEFHATKQLRIQCHDRGQVALRRGCSDLRGATGAATPLPMMRCSVQQVSF